MCAYSTVAFVESQLKNEKKCKKSSYISMISGGDFNRFSLSVCATGVLLDAVLAEVFQQEREFLFQITATDDTIH